MVEPVITGTTDPAGRPELLASCYRESLALAIEHRCRSVAFPCISTGVYRYPPALAVDVALAAVSDALAANEHRVEQVIFCCFSDEDLALYQTALS